MKDQLTFDDLNATPYHGLMRLQFEGRAERIAAVWSYQGYASLRDVIAAAVAEYEDKTNIRAEYAFVASLPKGVENATELGNVILFQSPALEGLPRYVVVLARDTGL